MEKLQPTWASGQPPATALTHNRRIEGSPKLKALLSLRLVVTERWSDRLISLCRPGWPWLWALVCAPSRHAIQSCILGPSGTRACQRDRKHKACTETQRQADCYWIHHFATGEWECLWFQISFSKLCLSPKNVLVNECEYNVPLELLWRWLPSACMSVAMQLFFLASRNPGCYVQNLSMQFYLWTCVLALDLLLIVVGRGLFSRLFTVLEIGVPVNANAIVG